MFAKFRQAARRCVETKVGSLEVGMARGRGLLYASMMT